MPPPETKHETLLALQRLLADPIFQWVLAEQESNAMLVLKAPPKTLGDIIVREQNFGRLAKVGEIRSWIENKIGELAKELKEAQQRV